MCTQDCSLEHASKRQTQPSGPPRPAQPASGGPPARAAKRARRAAPRRYNGGAAPAAEYTAFGEQTVTTGSADFVPWVCGRVERCTDGARAVWREGL